MVNKYRISRTIREKRRRDKKKHFSFSITYGGFDTSTARSLSVFKAKTKMKLVKTIANIASRTCKSYTRDCIFNTWYFSKRGYVKIESMNMSSMLNFKQQLEKYVMEHYCMIRVLPYDMARLLYTFL